MYSWEGSALSTRSIMVAFLLAVCFPISILSAAEATRGKGQLAAFPQASGGTEVYPTATTAQSGTTQTGPTESIPQRPATLQVAIFNISHRCSEDYTVADLDLVEFMVVVKNPNKTFPINQYTSPFFRWGPLQKSDGSEPKEEKCMIMQGGCDMRGTEQCTCDKLDTDYYQIHLGLLVNMAMNNASVIAEWPTGDGSSGDPLIVKYDIGRVREKCEHDEVADEDAQDVEDAGDDQDVTTSETIKVQSSSAPETSKLSAWSAAVTLLVTMVALTPSCVLGK